MQDIAPGLYDELRESSLIIIKVSPEHSSCYKLAEIPESYSLCDIAL
jgi:hypothetical protein